MRALRGRAKAESQKAMNRFPLKKFAFELISSQYGMPILIGNVMRGPIKIKEINEFIKTNVNKTLNT